jgi:hypothetical protein
MEKASLMGRQPATLLPARGRQCARVRVDAHSWGAFMSRIVVLVAFALLTSCGLLYDIVYPTASIGIENATDSTIVEVYVSVASSEDWGANLIPSSIAPGDTSTIDNIPRKVIVVRVQLGNGLTVYSPELDLASLEMYKLRVVAPS